MFTVLYAVRATTEYKVHYQLIKHTFFSHFLHTLASNENKTQIITVLLSNSINIFIKKKKIISDKISIHTRMGAFSMNFFSFASEKNKNYTIKYITFFFTKPYISERLYIF